MAAESRRADPPVKAGEAVTALVASPCRFEFFQAVRLLKLAGRGKTPGLFASPAAECVRFGAHQSLAFPAGEIQSLTVREDGPPLMRVNFMGLTGPSGALPTVYTSLVLDRLRERDATMRDFYDLFNHRIISLFYRAWEKYRLPVDYESGRRGGLTHYFLDLLGLGTPGLQNRQAVADETFIFYSGLLAQRPLSAAALRQVLEDYFQAPARIEQFVGVWYALGRAEQCCLDESETLSAQLGWGAVVGDEVWYQQSRARIVLGPLSREQYLDFLPGGPAYEPLRAFARFFGGPELEFEARLVLKREETPVCRLGAEGADAPRLGWLTWVNTAGMDRDPGDTVLLL